jgi:hypothetical protein
VRIKVMCRVGQNRIYAPYMTVYLVISMPNTAYRYTPYIYMVLGNPSYVSKSRYKLLFKGYG